MKIEPSIQTNTIRDISIDQLRGIGIFFVVLGHLIFESANNVGLETEGEFWIKSIYAFHMPLFFIISGYLCYFSIQRNKFIEFLRKKTTSLLVPFIAWSAMAVALRVIMRHGVEGGIIQSLKGNLIRVFVFDLSVWFLLCLYLLALFFYAGYQLSKKIGFSAHIIILIVLILLPNEYFDFRMYGLEYPYFVIGYYLNKVRSNNKEPRGKWGVARFQINKRNTVIVSIGCLLVSVIGYVFNLPIYNSTAIEEIRFPFEAVQLIYGYFWALLMCLGFLMIVKTLCNNAHGKTTHLLTIMGGASIDIYGQHMVLVYIVMGFAASMINTSLVLFFVFCITTSIVLTIACAVVTKYILRKVPPYAVLFSGRKGGNYA